MPRQLNKTSGMLVYRHKKDIDLILNYLYKDSTVLLERKYSLYQDRRVG